MFKVLYQYECYQSKVRKKVLKEICDKLGEAEEFISEGIEETCSHKKLPIEWYFFLLKLGFLLFMCSCSVVSFSSLK